MSYIDCFNHSEVGSFLNICLYHPLEKLDEEVEGADQSCLVLGGGGDHWGGEHPSIKISNLDLYAAKYLDFRLDFMELDFDLNKDKIKNPTEEQKLHFQEQKEIIEKAQKCVEELSDSFNVDAFDRAYLFNPFIAMDDIVSLAKKAKKTFKISKYYDKKLISAFREEFKNLSSESKIEIMLGEVIFIYCRRLLKPQTHTKIKELLEILSIKAGGFYPVFNKAFKLSLPESDHFGNIMTWKDESKTSSDWNPVCFYNEQEMIEELKDKIIWRNRDDATITPS